MGEGVVAVGGGGVLVEDSSSPSALIHLQQTEVLRQ